MCSHCFFESNESSRICWLCGLEEFILNECTFLNCGFATKHSPFFNGYSRVKRFRGMVDILFWPSPANGDTKMLKHLFRAKRTLHTKGDIINAMHCSGLKDKRFSSIHIFCRLFDPNYSEPKHDCLFLMARRMLYQFEFIESKFQSSFSKRPFINYTFLLRHLLKKLGYFKYLRFVKKLKCCKRRKRYQIMLQSIENQSTTR